MTSCRVFPLSCIHIVAVKEREPIVATAGSAGSAKANWHVQ